MSLYDKLKSKAVKWRKSQYQSDFPTISEILDFNLNPETDNFRFLRKAQFEALETYWYLRLIEKTPKDKEDLLLRYEKFKEQSKGWYQLEFGFHYTPYNFDSNPEKDFFEQLLVILNENPADIEDIYFTGAIDDPNKTDFIFEYKGKDGRWHNYTPDFLIKKKNGKMLIIEVKAPAFRDEEKEKAIKEIAGLNPDRLKYEILITDRDEIGFENINKVKEAIYSPREIKDRM